MEEARRTEYADVLSVLTDRGKRQDIVSRVELNKEVALGKIPTKPSSFDSKKEDGTTETRNWVAVSAGEGVISLSRVLRFPLKGGWGTSSIEERLDKVLNEQSAGKTFFFTVKEYAVPENSNFDNKVPILDGEMTIKKAPTGLLK